jgi:DNA-binding response OmpR family regulator
MSGQRTAILLAGDNISDIEYLNEGLIKEGFRVLSVSDKERVVTIARCEVPNLILLDLQSCFDVCRSLKRNFVTEHVPIIALLSPAEEADRIAVLELGADDCMAKPFSFRELVLRIKCSLNRTRDKKGKARYKQAQHYSALTRRPSVPTSVS